MDYGPTGVLRFMWKKQLDDLTPPAKVPTGGGGAWNPPNLVGAAFDLYAVISCNGGKTWLAPVRVNAETSPPGPNRQDDLSYLALDTHDANLDVPRGKE
jgi:hypothetical protein